MSTGLLANNMGLLLGLSSPPLRPDEAPVRRHELAGEPPPEGQRFVMSRDLRARVMALLRESPEPLSVREISEALCAGDVEVRQALCGLRAQQRAAVANERRSPQQWRAKC